MGSIFNISIFMILLSLAMSLDPEEIIYETIELNDGTKHHIITMISLGLRIYTKID